MSNTYVDFVTDEHFVGCVREAYGHYSAVSNNDMKWLQRNGLDTFKMVFDMKYSRKGLEGWIKSETIRQIDKSNTNWIGNFHQRLLGGVAGWVNLGTGHATGVDLMKSDGSIYIELKNKHDTTKGSDLKHYFDQLKKIVDDHDGSVAYFAFITPKSGNSGNKVWKMKGKTTDDRVRKIWGTKVYELITGDENALSKTWDALPDAINGAMNLNHSFSQTDLKKMNEFFKYALLRG